MVDWNSPTTTTLYTTTLSDLKNRDLSALKMLEGTTETNLPTAAKKYNTSTNKFQSYNGSTFDNLGFHAPIDNHIADTTIHSPPPIGSGALWFTNSAPTGWLLCDGSAVSRTTYAALFAVIGTIYGVGDGSTTFNLPNGKKRFLVGRDAATAAIDTLAKVGGSWDHAHTTPAHVHTVATHTHTLSAHTHTQATHTHTVDDHVHNVPGHYHFVTANGGDINITSSGSHTHTNDARSGGSIGGSFNRPPTTTGGSSVTWTDMVNATNSAHTHPTGNFGGRVGNTSGPNGDSAFATSGSTTGITAQAGGGTTTNGPNIDQTGGSGTLSTTGGEGSGTSGSNNPPFLTVNFIIKF